jgi:serine protease inhibitor
MMSQRFDHSSCEYYEDDEIQRVCLPYKYYETDGDGRRVLLGEEGDENHEDETSGEELSMYFFLPTQRGGLPALLRQLSGEKLLRWIRKKTPFTEHKVPTPDGKTVYTVRYAVTVTLPKFSVESDVGMVQALKNLGMRDMFSPSEAELGGMAEGGGGKSGLFVAGVAHKAAMRVDELGTEASAVGYIVSN